MHVLMQTVILCDAKLWRQSYFVMQRCSGDNSELGAGTALLHCCTGEILPVGWPLHHLLSLHHGSIQVLVDLMNNWHQVCEIWRICQSTKPIASQRKNTHSDTQHQTQIFKALLKEHLSLGHAGGGRSSHMVTGEDNGLVNLQAEGAVRQQTSKKWR